MFCFLYHFEGAVPDVWLSHFFGCFSADIKQANVTEQKSLTGFGAQFALLIFLETLCLDYEPANGGKKKNDQTKPQTKKILDLSVLKILQKQLLVAKVSSILISIN